MTERRRFTAQEKLQCVERELKQRRFVYPRRVEAGKMSKPMMDEQLALMEAIVEDYTELAAKDRLL